MAESITKESLNKRIRNRIIEYLEWVSSENEVLLYQIKVPHVNISNEIFNQWDDWITESIFSESNYPESIYTEEERNAMKSFHQTWEVTVEKVPLYILTDNFIKTKEYHQISAAAATTLSVFMKRGKLLED